MNRNAVLFALLLAVFAVARVRGDDSVTFAVIGDYGGGMPAATLIRWLEPDFVVTTGDNNYSDTTPGSEDWETQIGQLYGDFIVGRDDGRYASQTSESPRFFPVVGNHDIHYGDGGMREGYLDYFHANPGGSSRLPNGMHSDEASYYDVRLGDIHLFALDSEAIVNGGTAVDQFDWLAETAGTSDAFWKFAFFHHSPYSSAWHRDHVAMQWPFAELGIDAVFTGHDHVYERIQRDTNYFVVGTGGGASLYPFFPPYVEGSNFRYNDNFGVMFVNVSRDVASFSYLSVYGDPIDQFAIVKDVPEPSGTILLILGSLGTMYWRRR